MKKVINYVFSQLMFNMAIENIEKLVASLHNKTEYVIHTRNSNQALNHRLFLKTVPRMIQFSQNAQLKPYINMNSDLTKKQKAIIKQIF